MRKLLDKLFCRKKASLIISLGVSFILYLLFLLFNNSPDKKELVVITPIVSVIGFFGVFLVIFIQVKNNYCPEWFLNFFELSVIIFFGIGTVVYAVLFFASGFQDFSPVLCVGANVWGAVSWAHNKRE